MKRALDIVLAGLLLAASLVLVVPGVLLSWTAHGLMRAVEWLAKASIAARHEGG